MLATDWATIGNLIGSLATAGAFIVAFVIALGERVKSRKAAERAQASLISGWLDLDEYQGEQRVRLLARNDSQSHVNDLKAVIVDTLHPDKRPYETWIPGLPPTHEPIVIVLDVEVPDHRQRYRYELTYEFTDVLNRRWRYARGEGLTLLFRSAPAVSYGPDSHPLKDVRTENPMIPREDAQDSTGDT